MRSPTQTRAASLDAIARGSDFWSQPPDFGVPPLSAEPAPRGPVAAPGQLNDFLGLAHPGDTVPSP